MGTKSRNKGKAGEREAAAEITRLFGVTARRGVQFQGGLARVSAVKSQIAIGSSAVPGVVRRAGVFRARRAALFSYAGQNGSKCQRIRAIHSSRGLAKLAGCAARPSITIRSDIVTFGAFAAPDSWPARKYLRQWGVTIRIYLLEATL
jgi:hypothetical protein